MSKAKEAESVATATPAGALVPYDPAKFLALQTGSDLAEAMQANMANGETINEQDLIRVKLPAGGGTQWTIPGIAGEEHTPTIEGLLVYYAPRGVLWPTEEVGNNRPLLVSYDLQTAMQVGDEFGDIDRAKLDDAFIETRSGVNYYSWKSPQDGGRNVYNAWGSSSKGKGKRCKESRMMAILRPGDAFPILINVPPGSLRNVVPKVKMLPVPHFRAVVKLGLEAVKNDAGKPYSRIVFSLAGQIDREQGDAVRKLYTVPLNEVLRSVTILQQDDFAGDES